MGKIFSKPVSSVVPAQISLENHGMPVLTRQPSTQNDTAIETHSSNQRIANTRRHKTIKDIDPRAPSSSYLPERLPLSSPFSEHEQDPTTCAGSSGSPVSPRVHTTESQGGVDPPASIDSVPYEIHPDTRKRVFRKSWFGDKQAVQVVCEDLRHILQQATTTVPSAGENAKLFSASSWITEPFEVVVHNRSHIVRRCLEIGEGHAQKHLEWFLERLEAHQPGLWQKQEEVLSGNCRQVLFKHLWLLYAPGSIVFSIDDGAWRAYIVERAESVIRNNTTILQIHALYLDFDSAGQRLISHGTMFEVASYASERQIGALILKPKWYIEQTTSVDVFNLMERGYGYFGFGGKPYHLQYLGTAWPKTSHDFEHRVIVDYSTSSRHTTDGEICNDQKAMPSCSLCVGESLGLDSYSEHIGATPEICANGVSHQPVSLKTNHEPHEVEGLLFCPSRLWAFSLKFKSWKLVLQDELRTIEAQDTALEQDLCFKPSRKEALETLRQIVSGHMKDMRVSKLTDSKEIVGRKGRGLNILLSGGSGTGKTLTAECLSEKVNAPLYSMTCGDLGVQADSLDCKLQETFARASNWNAMVLLDDVDMYVHQRQQYNLERNALQAIFLRHLECSDCLVFIGVSCRFDLVDSAFKSRVHVQVPFPDFDFGTQQNIWRLVIDRIPKDCLDKDELDYFIQRELGRLEMGAYRTMNGRQIRNCIDVALVLARKEASGSSTYKLTQRHIERILKLGKDFRDHVLQVKRDATELTSQQLFGE